jgi:hypothetical protein
MCWTHPIWKSASAGTFASFGLLPVMRWPVALLMPLPASGNHCQSLPVCGPYLAMEKLESFDRFAPTFATHPTVGIVIIAWAFAFLDCEMNVSPPSPGVALE